MTNKVKNRKFKCVSIIAISLIICTFSLSNVMSQEAIPASGGIASGSGGSVSYSIGQIIYSTYYGANGSLAQGIQQPYEISVVTEIEDAKGITLLCTAFPNPANEFVKLNIENYKTKNLAYQLYDINGKILISKKLIDISTTISMENLFPGIYFIKVTDNNKEVKTFKIIKN